MEWNEVEQVSKCKKKKHPAQVNINTNIHLQEARCYLFLPLQSLAHRCSKQLFAEFIQLNGEERTTYRGL